MKRVLSLRGAEYASLALLAVIAFGATYLLTRATRRAAVSSEPNASAAAVISAPLAASSKLTEGLAAIEPGETPPGMAWVPGGEFLMGTDDAQADPAERPAHRVRVHGFWIDQTEVTNAEFRRVRECHRLYHDGRAARRLESAQNAGAAGNSQAAR